LVQLKSKQADIFEVDRKVICRSVTIENMVQDTVLDTPVPLHMIDSVTLVKVCTHGARSYVIVIRAFNCAACVHGPRSSPPSA